jgi:hypothetical protein
MDQSILASLAAVELKTLLALQSKMDANGIVKLTTKELAKLTGYSTASLRRGFRGLEQKGYLQTTRTRRNLAKYSYNIYKVLITLTNERSTHDYVSTSNQVLSTTDIVTNITDTTVITISTKAINTSYLLGATAPREEKHMVNRWSEDEDEGGFGRLFDEEKIKKQKPLSKRDPKTRHQRPHEEWTAADTASEFAYRAYDRIRGIPGLINTKNLRGALAANRAKFGITALIEVEIMDKFFSDERNLNAIRKMPLKAHGIFLRAITENVTQVVEDLKLDDVSSEESIPLDYVFASDGKKFDNSMRGREKLKIYEKSIGEKNDIQHPNTFRN